MSRAKLFPVPALRRRAIWAFVLAQLPQLINIAIMFVGMSYPALKVSMGTQIGALVVMIVLTLGAAIWIGVTSRRINRGAVARDGAVCVHCLYHLPVECAQGTCPECGHTFTHEENRLAWGVGSKVSKSV